MPDNPPQSDAPARPEVPAQPDTSPKVNASGQNGNSTKLDPQPRPEYYEEVRLSPSPENPRRLVFVSSGHDGPIPDEVLALRDDYSRTARVAAILFEDDVATRVSLFELLHQGADRGLRGPRYNITDGRSNLEECRTEIVDAAHKIRNKRLTTYTWLAILVGLLPLLVGALVYLTGLFGTLKPSLPNAPLDPVFIWTIAALWIPAGAAICVWAEFVLRMQGGLTFDQLLNLDPSRWNPSQRLQITIGISFIFAFLLAFDVVQIGLGNMLLNQFATRTPPIALAVGGVTGLAFAVVKDIIYRLKPESKTTS